MPLRDGVGTDEEAVAEMAGCCALAGDEASWRVGSQ